MESDFLCEEVYFYINLVSFHINLFSYKFPLMYIESVVYKYTYIRYASKSKRVLSLSRKQILSDKVPCLSLTDSILIS